MGSIEIDGVEYIPIDSVELDDGSEDIQERMTRAKEELQTKQAQRQAIENERELTAHINKYYGRELKDVGAFISLCKVKKLTADDDKAILNLFKNLPKSSRKNALSRFLKL